MLISDYLDGHPELSANTRRARGSVLHLFARQADLLTATTADIDAFLATPGWSAQTRHSYRAHVIAFYRWLHRTGQRADNPAAELRSYRVPRRQPRPLPPAVLAELVARATGSLRTAVLLGALAGLRCCEIAAVHTGDIDRDTLYVVGKGGVGAMLPLHPVLAADLGRYAGFLFPGPHGGHVSSMAIQHRIRGHMRACGVNATPHQLRHTFGTNVYANTRDLRLTQELLRHASPATTAIYTQIPDASRRAAVAALTCGAETCVCVSDVG